MNAIFPGSFDPFTRGHLDIVRRASYLFDKVYVAIAMNSKKTRTYNSLHMKTVIEDALVDEGIGPNVVVVHWSRSVAAAAINFDAPVIIRALRNGTDLEYETVVESGNRMLAADIGDDYTIEHVYLMCDPKYSRLSSTLARELMSNGASKETMETILPAAVCRYVFNETARLAPAR